MVMAKIRIVTIDYQFGVPSKQVGETGQALTLPVKTAGMNGRMVRIKHAE